MAVDLYTGFSNPIAGENFRCISFSNESFRLEWIVQPKGYVPFEHIHLEQDELFTVSHGVLRIVIEGVEYIAKAGETIVVKKGKRHIAFNHGNELLVCDVEYRPGLDNYKFFQCFGGLTIDKDFDSRGEINIPKMLFFTKKMNARCITRPTSVPAPMFTIALNLCYAVGLILGWNKLYLRYTGDVA